MRKPLLEIKVFDTHLGHKPELKCSNGPYCYIDEEDRRYTVEIKPRAQWSLVQLNAIGFAIALAMAERFGGKLSPQIVEQKRNERRRSRSERKHVAGISRS